MKEFRGIDSITFYKFFSSPENQRIIVKFLSDFLELEVVSMTMHSASFNELFAKFSPEDWLKPNTIELSASLSNKETIDVQLTYWSYYEPLSAIAIHALNLNQQQANSPNSQADHQIRELYVISFLRYVLFPKDDDAFRRIVGRTNMGLSTPEQPINEDQLNMVFLELTKRVPQ